MMKLEDQVCSLGLAKKLRELGVTQNSIWYWAKDGERDVVITDWQLIVAGGTPTNANVFSAFTVAELGEMLIPIPIERFMNEYPVVGKMAEEMGIDRDSLICFSSWQFISNSDADDSGHVITYSNWFGRKAENEANARAGMIAKLLESEILTFEEINNREVKHV